MTFNERIWGSRIRIKGWQVVDHCLVFPINGIIVTPLLSYSSIFLLRVVFITFCLVYRIFVISFVRFPSFLTQLLHYCISFSILFKCGYLSRGSFGNLSTFTRSGKVGVGLSRHCPPQIRLVGVHWVCCCCSGLKSSWFIFSMKI